MAQGGFKLSSNKPNAKKARAAQQRSKSQKEKNLKQLGKGPKSFAAKGRKIALAKQDQRTTKAINHKNENAVAARAVGVGHTFFCGDIKNAGKKELSKQKSVLTKRESKSAKMSQRLQVQLNKLK
mmetsp:Transcript_14783/g.32123  ORF Transcript_14783/g.32123 Transcript_14783/m.32123 type:complete len:125 (-) Transcript_14783:182-556(-)